MFTNSAGTNLGKCGGGGADNPLGKDVSAGLYAGAVGEAHEVGLSQGSGLDNDLLEAVRDEVCGHVTEVAGACLDEALREGCGNGFRLSLGEGAAVECEGCLALYTWVGVCQGNTSQVQK